MKYTLIIFDVDGTLVTKSGVTFRKSADDWQILPGRVEKLHDLKAQGVRLALASNQGGVAFGYMLQEDILHELHKTAYMLGITPAGVYVCYTHPKASISRYKMEDERRKPGPGMLQEAMADFEATPETTLMVGDRVEDELAARAAGCAFCYADEYFE